MVLFASEYLWYRATALVIAASILVYASCWSAVGFEAFWSDHVRVAEDVQTQVVRRSASSCMVDEI